MIGLLRGVILSRTDRSVLMDVNGVGYEIVMPSNTLAALPPSDEIVTVHTHLAWREDGISLFGFSGRDERDTFRLLLEVSGVGPRLALAILSALPCDELIAAIAANDSRRLQSIHGIGKRTAARLCVDLREKAKALTIATPGGGEGPAPALAASGSAWEGALAALMNLGYREQEARPAVEQAGRKLEAGARIEDILKLSLRILGRRR